MTSDTNKIFIVEWKEYYDSFDPRDACYTTYHQNKSMFAKKDQAKELIKALKKTDRISDIKFSKLEELPINEIE